MMKNKFFLSAGLLLLVACIPSLGQAKTATSIEVAPASASVKAGQSITWTVISTYDDASTEDVSGFALFAIPAAAGGSLSSNVYTSEVPGTYTLPVTVGSFSDTVTLTVVHGDPISLELNASGATLVAGQGSVSFTGTLRDSVGNTWDATGQLLLTSDDTKATIAGAVYTSTHAGTWTVTAAVGSLQASRQVTVNPANPSKISIEGDGKRTVEIIKETTLIASVTDEYGNVIAPNITWSSSSDAVTVDENGKVTAIKVGEASVTATSGTLLASVAFTVTEGTAANANTAATNANTSSDSTNTNATDEDTSGGISTEDTNGNENVNAAEEESEESCDAIALWIPIVILAIYALILYGYFMLIRKEKDNTWWIFPVLLTVIGVIVWNKYMCPDTLVWWPFLLAAIGFAMTGYGRGTLTKSDSDTPGSNDPQEQNPMF